jgi:hypothetical protein
MPQINHQKLEWSTFKYSRKWGLYIYHQGQIPKCSVLQNPSGPQSIVTCARDNWKYGGQSHLPVTICNMHYWFQRVHVRVSAPWHANPRAKMLCQEIHKPLKIKTQERWWHIITDGTWWSSWEQNSMLFHVTFCIPAETLRFMVKEIQIPNIICSYSLNDCDSWWYNNCSNDHDNQEDENNNTTHQ